MRAAQWRHAASAIARAARAASITAACAAAVYALLVLGTLGLIGRAFLGSAAASFSCPTATATATATATCGHGAWVGFASERGGAPNNAHSQVLLGAPNIRVEHHPLN